MARVCFLCLCIALLMGTGPGCHELGLDAGGPRDGVAYPPPPARARMIRVGTIRDWTDVEIAPSPLVEWMAGPFPPGDVLQKPAGMTTRSGVLYVCDARQGAVLAIDFHARSFSRIKDPDHMLQTPVDVLAGPDGTLFVADTTRGAVLQMTPEGAVRRAFRLGSGEEKAFRPLGLGLADDKLYVANAARHDIAVFDSESSVLIATIGGPGTHDGQFHFPVDVSIHGDRLYVLDMMNCRVQAFSPDGQWLRSFGGPGNRPGYFGRPKQLAIGPDGTVFVADAASQRVHVFAPEGQILMTLGGLADGKHGFTLPGGVCVSTELLGVFRSRVPPDFEPEYVVFVADQIGDPRIEAYAFSGAPGREGETKAPRTTIPPRDRIPGPVSAPSP